MAIELQTALNELGTDVLNNLETRNILWVSKNGNNNSAQKNRFDRPYGTIMGAISAATSGDLVNVLSGDYSGKITLKDGVNVHCESGVLIRHSYSSGGSTVSPHNTAVITDDMVAVNCRWTGEAKIYQDTSNEVISAYGLVIGNSSSNVIFEANSIETTAEVVAAHAAIRIVDCLKANLKFNLVKSSSYDGLWVSSGVVSLEVNTIEAYDNCVETADSGFDLIVDCKRMIGLDPTTQTRPALNLTGSGSVIIRNPFVQKTKLLSCSIPNGAILENIRFIQESVSVEAISFTPTSETGILKLNNILVQSSESSKFSAGGSPIGGNENTIIECYGNVTFSKGLKGIKTIGTVRIGDTEECSAMGFEQPIGKVLASRENLFMGNGNKGNRIIMEDAFSNLPNIPKIVYHTAPSTTSNLIVKSTTGYIGVQWWDGSIETMGDGNPSTIISPFSATPPTYTPGSFGFKEILVWATNISDTSPFSLPYEGITELYFVEEEVAEIRTANCDKLTRMTVANGFVIDIRGCPNLINLSIDGFLGSQLDIADKTLLTSLEIKNCPNIKEIDITQIGECSLAIIDNPNLERIVSRGRIGSSTLGFPGYVSAQNGGGDFSNNALTKESIEEWIVNSGIPAATPSRVNFTGNPGALTADLSLKGFKGWEIIVSEE